MSVHFKDYGSSVMVELRNGPEIAAEARCLKTPSFWIVDDIKTSHQYRGKGYARQLVSAIKEASGHPVKPFSVDPSATGFWRKMSEAGLADYEEPTPEPNTPPNQAL